MQFISAYEAGQLSFAPIGVKTIRMLLSPHRPPRGEEPTATDFFVYLADCYSQHCCVAPLMQVYVTVLFISAIIRGWYPSPRGENKVRRLTKTFAKKMEGEDATSIHSTEKHFSMPFQKLFPIMIKHTLCASTSCSITDLFSIANSPVPTLYLLAPPCRRFSICKSANPFH